MLLYTTENNVDGHVPFLRKIRLFDFSFTWNTLNNASLI